ncbi:MAG: (Na+)-NQR maturation NqrM [Bermanella sp.]
MDMFIVVFTVMLLFVVLMAIGLILGRKPIKGSCGGMSAVGMESACDVCGGDQNKCDTDVKKANNNKSSSLGYDAS